MEQSGNMHFPATRDQIICFTLKWVIVHSQRGERMLREYADLVRRFTVEHAWRTVFADAPDSEVNKLRPENS
jgi:hypothetical protein